MLLREDTSPAPAAGTTRWVHHGEPWLLAWSAPDERAEERLRSRLADRLDERPSALPELAWELAQHRDPDHPVRGAAVVFGARSGAEQVGRRRPRRVDERAARPVAVLFDGHGAQHPRMAAQLYGTEPVFTAAMGELFGAMGADGVVLRAAWLAGDAVDAPERGQPLLLAVGHALAATLRGWGLTPAALLGHSVGEVAAATVAGVLGVADAARLMMTRAAAYQLAPAGGLLAVAASAEELAPFLDDDVCVGVVNGPRQTMLAGPEPALSAAAQRLRAAGRTCIPARIPLPFHSPVLAPLAAVSEAALAELTLRPPAIDLYSTITARAMTAREAVDPAFLASQVSRPVLFAPALDAMLDDRELLMVEAGPSRALTALARRHPAVESGRSAVVAMLPTTEGEPGTDRGAVLDVAAAVWLEGHQLDWPAVQHGPVSTGGGGESTQRGSRGPVLSVGDIY